MAAAARDRSRRIVRRNLPAVRGVGGVAVSGDGVTPSGIHVRNELALQYRDHVFQQEFAFLEPADPELVDHGVFLQAIDQVVEISVANSELSQSL